MKTRACQWLVLLLCSFMSISVLAENLVVVVNQANSTKSMTKTQVIDLYMGRYVAFPDGSKAAPVDIDDSTREKFYKLLIGMSLARVNAYWSRIKFTGRVKPPILKDNTKAAIEFVKTHHNAIAYLPESAVTNEMKVIYRIESEEVSED